MKARTFGDTATLDILALLVHETRSALWSTARCFSSSRLPQPTDTRSPGDAIESWETAPDGLTITGKLRTGLKFHDKAPINGRAADAQDVVAPGTASPA